MKEPLPKTIENTLMVMVTVVIFLLIISSYDRSSMSAPEYRHAAEASHGEIPKPQGHGR
jgi:hypothetical protein